MEGDSTIAALWESVDIKLLEKLDSTSNKSIWDQLVEEYVIVSTHCEETEYPKRIRDIMVVMLSLIYDPTVLQSDYSEGVQFTQTALDFIVAVDNHIQSVKLGKSLLNDLFFKYRNYFGECPSLFKKEPIQFLQGFATNLCYLSIASQEESSLNTLSLKCVSVELYAWICELSPRYAFIICETYPLYPEKLDGASVEKASLFLRCFSFQTVSSPIFDGEKLVFTRGDLDDIKEQGYIEEMKHFMTRIHKAQISILRTFLTASTVSCDYVLNLIAILTEVNRARRVQPIGNHSSDGLMMNLGMCLLEILDPYISKKPSNKSAKSFLCYVLSDTARVDFIADSLPTDQEEVECIINIMSWLRPMNYLGRAENDEKWWFLIRANPKVVDEAVEKGLQAKPSSTVVSYINALKGIKNLIFFEPSFMEWKQFYDYTYNYSLLGKRVSPVSPFLTSSWTCKQCKKIIVNTSCYKCLCCEHYILCSSCYKEERDSVVKQYTPPFSKEVLCIFEDIKKAMDIGNVHKPLSHFFTKISRNLLSFERKVPPIIHGFPPLVPNTDENIRLEDIQQDENYEYWKEQDMDLLDKYGSTLCFCSTNRPCKCHGPLSSFIRRTYNRDSLIPDNVEEGFVHHCTCFYCKTSPIIGTVYQCLHCSLQLCRTCYQYDIEEGQGFPSHQCNHVYILVYHPVAKSYMLNHNRNDLRTIPYGTNLICNELCMSGVTLDRFLITPTESNRDNLMVELIALLVKLMKVNQTGLFQDYQLYKNHHALDYSSKLRTIQLSVGCMNILYTNVCEHLSYTLLSLLTFYVPQNCPMAEAWNLNSIMVEKEFFFSPYLNNEVSYSKLCDIILLDIQPSPMFNLLCKTLLEVIQYMFEWYMHTMPVYNMKQDLESGEFDYTILLLLCCLNENVISNITTRMDIFHTFYVMCTMTKEKDSLSFLFGYPIIRHFLFIFSIKLFIDVTPFGDKSKVQQIQMEINKMISLLVRSTTCDGQGYQECTQLLEGLGISNDVFPLYIEDLIRQTSNEQDSLRDIISKYINHQNSIYRNYASATLEYIKSTVNLFVHLINNSVTRDIIMSGYLLKRTTSFFLLIISSITSSTFVDDIDAVSKFMNMNYGKWLSVIVEQLILLVKFAPSVDTLDSSVQPSIAVSIYSDPKYKNSVLISMVVDSFYDIKKLKWIQTYARDTKLFATKKAFAFYSIIQKIQEYKKLVDLLDSAIEDCSEEFLDPLMNTIMQDPVILPSGNRCDRSTIIRQLSICPIDPFTREPFTIDMIKPDIELKNRIQQYIRERVAELQKQE